MNKELEENEFWQTRYRGTNAEEYDIYVANTDDEPPKTFDEWLGE